MGDRTAEVHYDNLEYVAGESEYAEVQALPLVWSLLPEIPAGQDAVAPSLAGLAKKSRVSR